MLQVIVPPQVTVRYITFDGKQDLEQEIVRKFRSCSTPDLVHEGGKKQTCLVRIACHELENFYLGDLAAVA